MKYEQYSMQLSHLTLENLHVQSKHLPFSYNAGISTDKRFSSVSHMLLAGVSIEMCREPIHQAFADPCCRIYKYILTFRMNWSVIIVFCYLYSLDSHTHSRTLVRLLAHPRTVLESTHRHNLEVYDMSLQ